MYQQKLCGCGSGLPRQEVRDGYGIFLCFCCQQCKTEKLSGYRKDIFEHYDCDEPIDAED